MSENKYTLSGVCPYCPAVLDYSEDAKAVECHCCGNIVPTRILRPLNFAKENNAVTESDKRIADCVTSSSTGIIYFDNFCESFSWREFAMSEGLSIPTLDSIREVCKLKFPADPITYYLDFRCVAVPLMKKIDGLDVLEVEIIDNYKSDDISDLFEYVDLYSAITHAIVNKRDSFVKALESDIKLAKRFGADPHIVMDLERSFEVFKEKIDAVKAASNIEDVPGYRKAKELKDAKLAAKIRAIGIDAEKTYQAAKSLLEKGNVDNALHLFAAINGYKDSTKYIEENSTIFKFNDELAQMAGKFYVVRRNYSYEFDVSEPAKDTPNTLSLYEIVNENPLPTPAVTQMSDIIYNFGSKIFFIRNSVSICCYDTASINYHSNVKILDEAPSGDYVIDHETPIYYSSDKTKFFIRKKLREKSAKYGCFGRKKKKLNTINRANNYSIVLVDMDDVTSKTILPEVVDIMDYYNDKIFYTTVTSSEAYPSFRVYDIATGTDREILHAGCIIHNAKNGRIIYSLPSPSIYNMDIYSADTKTDHHSLIDSNISDYYTTYGNKVFYTVGTGECRRLYSANLDGTDKREVMENPGRICTISSGWLYYINGESSNCCLMKIKIDGTKNILVASRFGKLVKMTNGYIYYLSSHGDLKVVRNDGNSDTLIAPKIAGTHVIIDDKNVYYLKRDYIGPGAADNGYGYSLYSTDLFGKNLHKLSHDVDAMAEHSERYIYIRKKSKTSYTVTTPVDKKTTTTEIVEKDIITYEAYDKETGKFTVIVNLGRPTQPSLSYKKGFLFFKRRVTKDGMVSEIESKNEYRREGVATVGMIRSEEIAEAARLEEEKRLNSRRNRRKQAKRAKKEAKLAKKEAKRAKKEAERLENERYAEEEHEQMNMEIDAFNAETERLANEVKEAENAKEEKDIQKEAPSDEAALEPRDASDSEDDSEDDSKDEEAERRAAEEKAQIEAFDEINQALEEKKAKKQAKKDAKKAAKQQKSNPDDNPYSEEIPNNQQG